LQHIKLNNPSPSDPEEHAFLLLFISEAFVLSFTIPSIGICADADIRELAGLALQTGFTASPALENADQKLVRDRRTAQLHSLVSQLSQAEPANTTQVIQLAKKLVH
jgi:hypothetical protein